MIGKYLQAAGLLMVLFAVCRRFKLNKVNNQSLGFSFKQELAAWIFRTCHASPILRNSRFMVTIRKCRPNYDLDFLLAVQSLFAIKLYITVIVLSVLQSLKQHTCSISPSILCVFVCLALGYS